MLIFGFGVKETLLATLLLRCETCGQQAAHHVVRRARRFSLFFVPLLPLGSSHVDVCTYCGRALRVSREQAEAAARPGGG